MKRFHVNQISNRIIIMLLLYIQFINRKDALMAKP